MADLAETVKILKEAGARATFHENGQLKSIAFGPAAVPVFVGPDGQPIVEPGKERTAFDVVREDAPALDMDEEAATLYPLADPEPEDETPGDGRPTEVRDDMPVVVP